MNNKRIRIVKMKDSVRRGKDIVFYSPVIAIYSIRINSPTARAANYTLVRNSHHYTLVE
jgi:hypothetical protein